MGLEYGCALSELVCNLVRHHERVMARPLPDRPEQIRLFFHKPVTGHSPLVLVNLTIGQAAGLQPGDGKERLNAKALVLRSELA
jgi:hypothetical protein